MSKRRPTNCPGCGQAILSVTLPNGTRLPVDPTPDPKGNVCVLIDRETGEHTAWYATPKDRALVYRNHFATCPDAVRVRHE